MPGSVARSVRRALTVLAALGLAYAFTPLSSCSLIVNKTLDDKEKEAAAKDKVFRGDYAVGPSTSLSWAEGTVTDVFLCRAPGDPAVMTSFTGLIETSFGNQFALTAEVLPQGGLQDTELFARIALTRRGDPIPTYYWDAIADSATFGIRGSITGRGPGGTTAGGNLVVDWTAEKDCDQP